MRFWINTASTTRNAIFGCDVDRLAVTTGPSGLTWVMAVQGPRPDGRGYRLSALPGWALSKKYGDGNTEIRGRKYGDGALIGIA